MTVLCIRDQIKCNIFCRQFVYRSLNSDLESEATGKFVSCEKLDHLIHTDSSAEILGPRFSCVGGCGRMNRPVSREIIQTLLLISEMGSEVFLQKQQIYFLPL